MSSLWQFRIASISQSVYWLWSGRPRNSCREGKPMRNPSARPDILTRQPWLLALGQVLRGEYTEVEQPVPERLAALVKKLESRPPVMARQSTTPHRHAMRGVNTSSRARNA
jgi:hypothetical protein